jgi:hypothetical protein
MNTTTRKFRGIGNTGLLAGPVWRSGIGSVVLAMLLTLSASPVARAACDPKDLASEIGRAHV